MVDPCDRARTRCRTPHSTKAPARNLRSTFAVNFRVSAIVIQFATSRYAATTAGRSGPRPRRRRPRAGVELDTSRRAEPLDLIYSERHRALPGRSHVGFALSSKSLHVRTALAPAVPGPTAVRTLAAVGADERHGARPRCPARCSQQIPAELQVGPLGPQSRLRLRTAPGQDALQTQSSRVR